MATRLIFLAVVCVGSLAFGQEQRAVPKQNTPVQSNVTPAKQNTPGQQPSTYACPPGATTCPAPVTPAKQNTPRQSAVTPPTVTITATESYDRYTGHGHSPVTSAPVTPSPAAPAFTGMSMHFHVAGSFEASFEMNVNQGQAKQEKCKKGHIEPK